MKRPDHPWSNKPLLIKVTKKNAIFLHNKKRRFFSLMYQDLEPITWYFFHFIDDKIEISKIVRFDVTNIGMFITKKNGMPREQLSYFPGFMLNYD